MLAKKNRADTKTVEEIFAKGKFINSSNLTFKFILNQPSKQPRISFIAPKTIAKGAVERNALRRRGYTALGKYIDDFPAGLVGVFIYKKIIKTILEVENEIKDILHKIN